MNNFVDQQGGLLDRRAGLEALLVAVGDVGHDLVPVDRG
jgi:hypothetical protein